ncbi:fumarate hydratase C-terminal domain-containing protein [Candidatus Woesearchaeota archaeon]|nr:fumarate hydratase C-terminal domain-containing protein [Candidatus Woesearchaeota archaeon]
MIELKTPIGKEKIKKLKAGDQVSITGEMFTARDMAHKFLFENDSEKFKNLLKNKIIYHCGPIVKKENNSYEVIAAGPTTSAREEPYEAGIIKDYKIKAIIGKGGMGEKTLEACKNYNCVYLHAVGGAAALLAERITKVINIYKKEFGMPEAIWHLKVEKFPALVTMDANGNSLHKDVLKRSRSNYEELIKQNL